LKTLHWWQRATTRCSQADCSQPFAPPRVEPVGGSSWRGAQGPAGGCPPLLAGPKGAKDGPSFLRCRRLGLRRTRPRGRCGVRDDEPGRRPCLGAPSGDSAGPARTPTYGTPPSHRFRGGAEEILHKCRRAPLSTPSRRAKVPRQSSDDRRCPSPQRGRWSLLAPTCEAPQRLRHCGSRSTSAMA
jgi:hypothetical protein